MTTTDEEKLFKVIRDAIIEYKEYVGENENAFSCDIQYHEKCFMAYVLFKECPMIEIVVETDTENNVVQRLYDLEEPEIRKLTRLILEKGEIEGYE